jgi:hypothetical protein
MIEVRAWRICGTCLEMQVRIVDLTEGSEITIRKEFIGKLLRSLDFIAE